MPTARGILSVPVDAESGAPATGIRLSTRDRMLRFLDVAAYGSRFLVLRRAATRAVRSEPPPTITVIVNCVGTLRVKFAGATDR